MKTINRNEMPKKPILIEKRNKELANFDNNKISNAILKAMKSNGRTNEALAIQIAKEIEETLRQTGNTKPSIYQIEDMVFSKLIAHDEVLVAKAYEGYKTKRQVQRQFSLTDPQIEELMGGESEYWNTENSNKNPTLNTTVRDYFAGIVSKDITERKLLPPDVTYAHDEGIIHFHDADYFAQTMYNCSLVNLEDMLQNGTVISETLIEKPHSFSTACNIATQIIAQVASSQYGGQSISLAHLAPFVDISRQKIREEVEEEVDIMLSSIGDDWGFRYEDTVNQITEKRLLQEIKKGVQTIQYQVVTLMTTNGQAPFLTLFMYLNEAKNEQEKKDLAMIIEEVIKQRKQGVKNESGAWVTPAFPKLIYVLEDDNVDEDSEYYYLTELSAECTTKRLVPDYISEKVMKQWKEGNCFPVMGCRSALSPWKDENGNYKFYGRFNCGVVTLNLPDVALSSDGDMDLFWQLMDERTELCHKALLCRYNRLKGTRSDVAPILWQHGALARLKKGETIDKLLKGGYSTISLGYAGLYECVKYMTGNSHTDGGEGTELGLQVMNFLNDKCEQWKVEDDLGYGVYGSPIESTTYKFAKCLKKRFGEVEGITDRDYITNSYHVPVFENIDAFSKLSLESKLQALSSGGAISYVEMPNMTNNVEAVLEVIKFMYDNVMYAELNTKSDHCSNCGFDGEILIDDNLEWYCPDCGNRNHDTLQVARRTCGYIGTQFWNHGRTQEIASRVLHLDNKKLEV